MNIQNQALAMNNRNCFGWASFGLVAIIEGSTPSPSTHFFGLLNMAYEIELNWKIIVELPDGFTTHDYSPYFNVKTGKSLLRTIGGFHCSTQFEFVPDVLEPTSQFYSQLKRRMAHLIHEKKKPFTMNLSLQNGGTTNVRVNFKLHRYVNQLCLGLLIAPFSIDKMDDLSFLKEINNHSEIKTLTSSILSIITGVSILARAHQKNYPCLKIINQDDCYTPSDEQLVSLLTRHTNAREHIVTQVIAKNEIHQLNNSRLLLDRQGIVFHSPMLMSKLQREDLDRRFTSSSSMLELASVIFSIFHKKSDININQRNAIERLILDPEMTLPESISAQHIWILLSSEFQLSSLVTTHKEHPNNNMIPHKVICLAAANVEFQKIGEILAKKFGSPKLSRTKTNSSGNAFNTASIYTDKDSNIEWYLCDQSFQGNSEAGARTAELRNTINPGLILMVGMCMGMPHKKLAVGTVIIPNEIFTLDHSRITSEGMQYRPHVANISPSMHEFASHVARAMSDFNIILDKGMATAMAKIENQNSPLIEFIKKNLPDVVAYDMESWGFSRGLIDEHGLLIKGVADSAEHQNTDQVAQSDKKIIQGEATENAMNFAMALTKAYFQ